MDNICKICNKEFIERSHFWKNHKVKEKDYYESYIPKYDLLTKEKIEFKNPEQYELTDFKDKRNLKKYLEKTSKEGGIEYLKNWILKRKNIKNLIYFPTEFEIKSLCFPSINYLNQHYEDCLLKLCKSTNLINRFNYNQNLFINSNENLNFLIDSREQSILNLKNFQISKLSYGDYTIDKSSNNVFIERKSLNDFIGTLSKGYERLIKEIERCKKDNNYLIILIEEKYSNLLSFNYLPHCKKIKATPDFIIHRFRELLYNYPLNLQMLAVNGRTEASRVMEKIFRLNNIKEIDLQYYYNKGDL